MIQIRDLRFSYPGAGEQVLNGLSLDIQDGEFLCIIGKSGCGKSTLLRVIAGLELPQSGQVLADGAVVTGPSIQRPVLFQSSTLFPWLTVRDNVVFAIRKRKGCGRREAIPMAQALLERVGLAQDLDKYPYQLSGGMRQRTALARVLAVDAPYFLLDEPFGALDTKTRRDLQALLLRLRMTGARRKTIIFVTHDLEEAMFLGSRIVLLKDGMISREKSIPAGINRCCRDELGLKECTEMKEELSKWYD